jgi:hypothetical protein
LYCTEPERTLFGRPQLPDVAEPLRSYFSGPLTQLTLARRYAAGAGLCACRSWDCQDGRCWQRIFSDS